MPGSEVYGEWGIVLITGEQVVGWEREKSLTCSSSPHLDGSCYCSSVGACFYSWGAGSGGGSPRPLLTSCSPSSTRNRTVLPMANASQVGVGWGCNPTTLFPRNTTGHRAIPAQVVWPGCTGPCLPWQRLLGRSYTGSPSNLPHTAGAPLLLLLTPCPQLWYDRNKQLPHYFDHQLHLIS